MMKLAQTLMSCNVARLSLIKNFFPSHMLSVILLVGNIFGKSIIALWPQNIKVSIDILHTTLLNSLFNLSRLAENTSGFVKILTQTQDSQGERQCFTVVFTVKELPPFERKHVQVLLVVAWSIPGFTGGTVARDRSGRQTSQNDT